MNYGTVPLIYFFTSSVIYIDVVYEFMIHGAVSFKMNEGYNEEFAKEYYDLYHNCWKYLMPICQKIKNVTIEEEWDLDIPQVKELQVSILNLEIETIWESCVSFVKYYNKRKAEESLTSA